MNEREKAKYMREVEGFIKEDLQLLWQVQHCSVFLVNSHSVPLYPADKDTVDAWCCSMKMQEIRMEFYLRQCEIAGVLALPVTGEIRYFIIQLYKVNLCCRY